MNNCMRCQLNTYSDGGAGNCMECDPGQVSDPGNTQCGKWNLVVIVRDKLKIRNKIPKILYSPNLINLFSIITIR